MNIKQTLEGVKAVAGSGVDLKSLADLHATLQDLAKWTSSISQPKASNAAKALARIIEETILDESPDFRSVARLIVETVASFEFILIDGRSPAMVKFPDRLGIDVRRGKKEKASSDEVGETLFMPPKFLVDATGKIGSFVSEASDHVKAAEVHLLALESDPRDQDAYDAVQRAFHAIKRGATYHGLDEIKFYSYEIRYLVEKVFNEYGELTPTAIDAALDASDNLRKLIEHVTDALITHKPLAIEIMLPEWAASLRDAAISKKSLLAEVTIAPGAAKKRLGELLVETGITTESGIETALRFQKEAPQRKKVGDILLDEVLVSKSQLEEALRIQQQDPNLGKIGDILVEMGAVKEEDIQAALNRQHDPRKQKLGEVLVRSGQASAKGIAKTVRSQGILRDMVRFGMGALSRMVSVGDEKEEVAPKPAREDVGGDVKYIEADGKLTVDFIARSREHLAAADVNLLSLESETEIDEALLTVWRAFHSIQRTASFLGFDDIKMCASEAEHLADRARKGKLELQGPILDIAFDAVDCLKRHIDYLEESYKTDGPIKTEEIMPQMIAQLRAVSAGNISAIARIPRPQAPSSTAAPKKLGELLIEAGVTTQEGIEAALRLQQEPPKPQRLGDVLVEQAKISRAQLEEALRLQHAPENKDKKLGDILVEMGAIDPEDIDPALLTQRQPKKLKLGEALVRSGHASAKSVAQALRSQKFLYNMVRVGATAAVITGTFMTTTDAHAQTSIDGGGASVQVTLGTSPDTDGDSLTDVVETSLGTDIDNYDTDSDGMDDAFEVHHGMSPTSADDAGGDSDNDGLTNLEEYQSGASPNEVDTDHDGYWDSVEVDRGSDVASADSTPSTGIVGDVDADGQVGAVDIQTVINAALGEETSVPTDVNQVGDTNAVDVQLTINAALGNSNN